MFGDQVDALFDKIVELEISMADFDEKFVRGSGAGGQKINKTNSKVQLTHTPTGLQVAPTLNPQPLTPNLRSIFNPKSRTPNPPPYNQRL